MAKVMNSLMTFRKVNNFTIDEFAQTLGCSTSFYSKIERGYRQPSISFLKKLKTNFPRFDLNEIAIELVSND